MRTHSGILSFQCRHFRILHLTEDRPRLSRELFELANFVSSTSDLITLTLRTPCRLLWHVIAWGRAAIPTSSPRTTTCLASAITLQWRSVLRLQLRATAVQPSNRKQNSVPSSSQWSHFWCRRTDGRHRRCDHVSCDRRFVDSVSSFKLQLPRSTLVTPSERTRDREECFCSVYEQQLCLSRPQADKVQSCRWQSHAGRELPHQ